MNNTQIRRQFNEKICLQIKGITFHISDFQRHKCSYKCCNALISGIIDRQLQEGISVYPENAAYICPGFHRLYDKCLFF